MHSSKHPIRSNYRLHGLINSIIGCVSSLFSALENPEQYHSDSIRQAESNYQTHLPHSRASTEIFDHCCRFCGYFPSDSPPAPPRFTSGRPPCPWARGARGARVSGPGRRRLPADSPVPPPAADGRCSGRCTRGTR